MHCAAPTHLQTTRSTSAVQRWWLSTLLLAAVILASAVPLAAQSHEHAAQLPARDARLELVLGGPHVMLYHSGYLDLGEDQVSGLQELRRTVCDAEVVYAEQSAVRRTQLSDLLGDAAPLPPLSPGQSPSAAPSSALHEAMAGLASAESAWLTALMRARRDALSLLSVSQRAQLVALREHWAREAEVMIEDATRPGQRGHPGTQIPIRVPGMVVGATTLLPYCEALHGPSLHISMPPPR